MGKKPDILLIISDQHRGDCLSIEDHPVLITPTLDSLAYNGIRFTKAYSSCPVCIPARRSLISGQFPQRHGMVGYKEGVEWEPDCTLAGVLSNHGYQTIWVGRSMHLWPPRKRYGFDHMIIADHRGKDVNDYGEFLSMHGERFDAYYETGVMHNDYTARPWHLKESLHCTNWTVDVALDFLRKRDPSCPLFLVVSFLAPHPPLVPPACYFERYIRTGVPEPFVGDWAVPPENNGIGLGQSSTRVNLSKETLLSCRAGYYGLINHMDDQINRLVNPVNGVDKNNTIIIYTSDHGEMLGDHYLWRKSQPYEPSARIPLLMWIPPQYGIKGKMVIDTPVCLEDIMPTILALLGIEIPESVDGKNLIPVLKGQQLGRKYLHIEHAPFFHALTDGKEKFIWFVKDGREQFFDLTVDPHELHNLINDTSYKEKIAWWQNELVKVLKDRPEGFSDGEKLIPGKNYTALINK